MARSIAVLLFFLFNLNCSGQGSDLLLLKKKNGKTIKSFFSGTTITFTDINYRKVTGVIRKIQYDTVYISYYDIRRAYTMWGTTVADTLTAALMRWHYTEIVSIAKDPKAFEFVRNGTLFIIGGTAYALLHSINALIQNGDISGKSMAIAGAVVATGVVMKILRKKSYRIGKKYQLKYVGMTR